MKNEKRITQDDDPNGMDAAGQKLMSKKPDSLGNFVRIPDYDPPGAQGPINPNPFSNPKVISVDTPQSGTRAMEGKSSSGEFKYRFATDTPVTCAKEVPGAKKRAQDVQTGTNLSRLPKDSPPGGNLEEPGDGEVFEKGVIGVS